MTDSKWHATGTDSALKYWSTDRARGLTSEKAAERLAKVGPNRIQGKKGPSALARFLSQFKDLMILILMGAAVVSGLLREWLDTAAILAIVLLNGILGFIQEERAERALAALKRLTAPTAKVLRDGTRSTVPAESLVPGDIVELEVGDRIAADVRLVTSGSFCVDESALTGESVPVEKDAKVVLPKDTPLADRRNLGFMSTIVTYGKAVGLVVATGMHTELGKIAELIQEGEKEPTPLQKNLESFGRYLVYGCLGVCALVFILGLSSGGEVGEMFLTAVSLAVAAIPEGLPAVVTIALALGVHRMVKRHALIRKLPVVETLGCATVICSDKTGTLTRNEMTVRQVYAGGERYTVSGNGYEPSGVFSRGGLTVSPASDGPLLNALTIAVLCNDARLEHRENSWHVRGDPTEGALLAVAGKAGLFRESLETEQPVVREIPFDSERKRMSVIRTSADRERRRVYMKGAPDTLLELCTSILTGNGVEPLTARQKLALHQENESLARDALRVLAVAQKDLGADEEALETEMTFVGLLGMMDPPRPEVGPAIETCREAGIMPVMITGDHKLTALAVARELGSFREGDLAFTGAELDFTDDEKLEELVDDIKVYARVSAEHKMRIVRAFKKRGEIIAMTGDGVNDAPAVREAHIGVAMGITGTDVTKEASDMVLADDNFASIVAAVEEGRGIFSNIKKFVHFLLSCNTGEVATMLVASLARLPLPLLPIQILWTNLITDGLPALALGVDPPEPDIMKRPARKVQEGIISRNSLIRIGWQGLLIAGCTVAIYSYALFIEHRDLETARVLAFNVLVGTQLFHSFSCRSERHSLFKLGVFSNLRLVAAVVVSLGIQMALVFVPFLQPVFRTKAVPWQDWDLVMIVSTIPFWVTETVKAIGNLRRGARNA